ncbi:caspase family protein [Sorangium sp. So ce854]|uniref:caspase family protein n=1 Tax=Sorangium sp. So ce854 TaxID=3133322 RepID=UPI003F60F17F
MAKRAIVIGVERYPNRKNDDVPGAVADALAFYDWVTSDEGVPPESIALHLSPLSGRADARPATAAQIERSIAELRRLGEGCTERLFVYYSGHGFASGTDMSDQPEPAIVCEDFESIEWTGRLALKFRQIREVLRGLGPGEQYFFLDCCRTIVTRERLSLGEVAINVRPAANGEPAQGTLWSTAPGRAAAAATAAGERSAFTEALLAGLRGEGRARAWRDESLIVEFHLLASHVNERLRSDGQEAYPETRGLLPPLRVLYPPEPLPTVPCEVTVEGASPDDAIELEVSGRADDEPKLCKLTGGRGAVELVVGFNRIKPRLHGCELKPPSVSKDFFTPDQVRFRVVRRRGSAPWGDKLRAHAFERGLLTDAIEDAVHPVNVHLELPRSSATIRLRDQVGRERTPAIADHGGRRVALLLPGKYRLEIEEAGLLVHEQVFEVRPGASQRVTVVPPDPVDPTRRSLLARVREESGWISPSESLGPLADHHLPLWLSLLAVRAVYDVCEGLAGIPAPPVRGVPARQAALMILMTASSRPEVALFPLADGGASRRPVALEANGAVEGLWHGVVDTAPGGYLLGWAGGRAAIALYALPDRVTCFIGSAGLGAPGDATLLSLPLPPWGGALPEYPPVFVRWLEHAQRAFFAGRAIEGPTFDRPDPIYDVIAAYAALRAGARMRAAEVLERLEAAFPDLPDVAALQVLVRDAPPRPAGVPTVMDGALALCPDAAMPGCPPRSVLAWGSAWTRWAAWP